jgi:hypothetical protein
MEHRDDDLAGQIAVLEKKALDDDSRSLALNTQQCKPDFSRQDACCALSF